MLLWPLTVVGETEKPPCPMLLQQKRDVEERIWSRESGPMGFFSLGFATTWVCEHYLVSSQLSGSQFLATKLELS